MKVKKIVQTINGRNFTAEDFAKILSLSKDKSGKYDLSGLTVNAVWTAVSQYLEGIPTTTSTTTKPSSSNSNNSQVLYQNAIIVLKGANEGKKIVLTINGRNFTAEDFAQILSLSKDKSGKYDLSGLTVNVVWTAGTETSTKPSSSSSNNSEVLYQNVINILKGANEGKKIVLMINGRNFLAENFAQILGLSKDMSGKYVINGLTVNGVWTAITQYLKQQ